MKRDFIYNNTSAVNLNDDLYRYTILWAKSFLTGIIYNGLNNGQNHAALVLIGRVPEGMELLVLHRKVGRKGVLQQIIYRDVETFSEKDKLLQSDRTLAAFDQSHIGSGNIDTFCHLFLR